MAAAVVFPAGLVSRAWTTPSVCSPIAAGSSPRSPRPSPLLVVWRPWRRTEVDRLNVYRAAWRPWRRAVTGLAPCPTTPRGRAHHPRPARATALHGGRGCRATPSPPPPSSPIARATRSWSRTSILAGLRVRLAQGVRDGEHKDPAPAGTLPHSPPLLHAPASIGLFDGLRRGGRRQAPWRPSKPELAASRAVAAATSVCAAAGAVELPRMLSPRSRSRALQRPRTRLPAKSPSGAKRRERVSAPRGPLPCAAPRGRAFSARPTRPCATGWPTRQRRNGSRARRRWSAELRKLWRCGLRTCGRAWAIGSDRVLSALVLRARPLAAGRRATWRRPTWSRPTLTALLGRPRLREAERDLRAYDGERAGSTPPAHTADLLKFLARTSAFPGPTRARITPGTAPRLATRGRSSPGARTSSPGQRRADGDPRKDLDPALAGKLALRTDRRRPRGCGTPRARCPPVRGGAERQACAGPPARAVSVVPDPPPAVGEPGAASCTRWSSFRYRFTSWKRHLRAVSPLLTACAGPRERNAPFGAGWACVLDHPANDRERGPTSAWPPITSSSRSATVLWRGYKTGVGSSPRSWPISIRWKRRWLPWASRCGPWSSWRRRRAGLGGPHRRRDPRGAAGVPLDPGQGPGAMLRDTRVVQVDSRRKKILNAEGVRAKYGVPPALIPDFLPCRGRGRRLSGDPGIGPVTAARLLRPARPPRATPAAASGGAARHGLAVQGPRHAAHRRSLVLTT